jgi:hypothetical protein
MVTMRDLLEMQGHMAERLAELKDSLPRNEYTLECMYCRKDMGVKPGRIEGNRSSSICNSCLETYYPQYAAMVKHLRQAA